jgi:RHS repeat-associated protein
VEKANGTTASSGTIYWYMSPGIVAESDLAGTLKSEYVFFGGQRVARRDLVTPTGVFYYFSDHLKTASVITDSAGVIQAESDYYPWGGESKFVNADSNHYRFTGKERDAESGLDYFGARYYSNRLGRFISADWSGTPIPVPYADFGDPQTLNLYTYVRNVPTVRFDADGHQSLMQAIQRCATSAPCATTAGVGVAALADGAFIAGIALGPGALAMEAVYLLPTLEDQGIIGDALTPTYQPAPTAQSDSARTDAPAASNPARDARQTGSSGDCGARARTDRR